MNVLVTGGAGFIGFYISKVLLERGDNVAGLDNFNDYYDPSLKEDRIKLLEKNTNYKIYRTDFSNYDELEEIFKNERIDKICHLGAQAGVRYSLENPHAYEKSNLAGTLNIFEAARHFEVKDVVYASSSSVYGMNKKIPFSETDNVDNPISLYAATKKANELMAYTYHHLYGINMTGLRFFTVYGPMGRPDMAYFSFTKDILSGKTIKVFNNGDLRRDFTYIDDIVAGVIKCIDNPFPYEIINLGNNKPVALLDFIQTIEKELGQEAKKEMLPMQPGDVLETYANIDKAKKLLGYDPKTDIQSGINKFISWYKEYYKI
ncbi:NAD-dependent epimerase [Patescibacteria group bacterium]|nr:NAD-dependent epimerase [Patescibacteria group bacterium]MBU1673244.1 NAD-dependent epimerase [Patescibacteria group bacterium]MBU1963505.1 NAD-dependent epimerase [Patescibacteria group bacterium]